jgi:hypothetical protein
MTKKMEGTFGQDTAKPLGRTFIHIGVQPWDRRA